MTCLACSGPIGVGSRIEIPVHYDLWMQGAQYGRIKDITEDGTWKVKMEHPQVKYLVRIPKADHEFCTKRHG